MSNFSARLAKAIDKSGKMKRDIASEAGLSPQQISFYLGDHGEPKWETVELLAGALGVNPFWLKFGIDDPLDQARAQALQAIGVTIAESAPPQHDRVYELSAVSERGSGDMPFGVLHGKAKYVIDPRAPIHPGATVLCETGRGKRKEAFFGKVELQDANFVFIMQIDQGRLKKFERDAVRLSRAIEKIETL